MAASKKQKPKCDSRLFHSPPLIPDRERPRATRTRRRDNARTRYGGQSNFACGQPSTTETKTSPRESSIVPRYPSGVLTIRRIGRLLIYYPHAIGTKTRKRPPRHTCSGAGAVGPPCPPCCPAASTHGRGTASVRHSAARRGPSSPELTYRSWARAEARAGRHPPRCWPSRPRWRGAGPWRAGPCPLAWRAASWWCSARGAACRTAGGYPAADPGRARASRPGRWRSKQRRGGGQG